MEKINKLKEYLRENNITWEMLSRRVCKIDSTVKEYGKGSYSYWINGIRPWPGKVAFAVSRAINGEFSVECLLNKAYIEEIK